MSPVPSTPLRFRHGITVRWLPLLLMLVCASSLFARRDKYRITLTIEGNRDSVMMLGYYYGDNSYLLDSARRDGKGRFVFSSKERELLPGMYFFSAAPNRWIDFVVYHESPYFTFTTDEADWVGNMQVKGSKENEIFYNYQRGNKVLNTEYDLLMRRADSTARKRLQGELRQRQNELKMGVIRGHPDCMISKVMRSTTDMLALVPLRDANGDTLTNAQRFSYFMAHYFDSVPLDDDMLVRTPKYIFYKKFNDYFDVYLKGASPDVIISYADSLIERARSSKENFKWIVHTVKEKYMKSNITVYEAIPIHIIRRYYATGEAWWVAPSTLDEMVAAADKLEPLLIGKTAPELILFDTLHVPHSLHHTPHRYKLLVFWSPSCGHCKVLVPALYERLRQLQADYDIGGFAVLSEPDAVTRPKWHAFIAEHGLDWLNLDGGEANIDWHEVYNVVSTPQVYLLDENNVIMAKSLTADTFEQVVRALCKPKAE